VGAPTLEGIDVRGALERLGIDFPSLGRMLVRFASGQRATLAALRDAVAAGDAAGAARHAHAIAGAAGNLGADPLRAAAKALELAGRAGSGELAALFAEVDRCAAVVFRSIGTLQPEESIPATPGRPFVAETARAALERLSAALADSDLSAAGSALAELGGIAMPGEAASDLAQLRNHVDGYEFEEAGAVAARLLQRIGAASP
jgi:HPt (histidine-containing phosphotransfer) domain-containing protein